ncbi:hypothetical protein C0989_009043, partial [Termitomyces sp. Mn162]
AFIKSFLNTPLSPLTPTNSIFFPEAQSIPSSPTNPLCLLNPTITNMNNDPAARRARMPPCNDTTVPKWDESHPRELPQYFKELEYLFADCGITDNTQKKEYASQYISYDTAETWLGLPEFGNNIGNNTPRPYTYQEWKLAVLRLYSGTDARISNMSPDGYLLMVNSIVMRNVACSNKVSLHRYGPKSFATSKSLFPNHHPEDPYNVDQVFEGAEWILKGMDTSMTKTSNGTSGIPLSLPIANAPAAPLPMPKQETLELTTTTVIVSTLERLEALLTNGNTQPCQQFANSTCHFCGEIGHTMVQGTCMKLEQMIQQGKVHWNAKGKIILPSGTMIPNYFGKQLYMEHIKEWHRLNPGQIVTSRLSSNANLDPEQAAMQQSLIHKVMQQDVTMGQALSKEEQIKALEHELFALR